MTHSEIMGRCRLVVAGNQQAEERTVYRFSRCGRQTATRWESASATQILVADPATVERLAAEATSGEEPAAVEGVLIAVRHPTGWFVHGVRRDDVAGSRASGFRELVTVRTYLLLTHGPATPAWRRTSVSGEWRSISFSAARDLAALDDALVTG